MIASAGPQSVKRAYGGPAPFGVGLGVVEVSSPIKSRPTAGVPADAAPLLTRLRLRRAPATYSCPSQLEAASAEHAGRVATATARREQRQAFAALVQDASLPLPTGMTEAERADVAERRLRRRLAKFWGLLNEAGRPWQRSLILRLCDEVSRRN